LSFCLMTVLSYLLRFVPEDDRIRVELSHSDGAVHITISGVLPEIPERPTGSLDRVTLSKTVSEIELCEPILQRFMVNHRGTMRRYRLQDERTVFHLTLPAAVDV